MRELRAREGAGRLELLRAVSRDASSSVRGITFIMTVSPEARVKCHSQLRYTETTHWPIMLRLNLKDDVSARSFNT